MKKFFLILCLFAFVAACSKKEEQMIDASRLDFAYERLEFHCSREVDSLPALDADADVLYRYSLYLDKLKGKKDYNEIARYYRIAAAHDHYKAATNLQFLLSTGQARSPHASKEAVDLAEYFIGKGIPGAYYDMAHYLESGYGVKQDVTASKAYFRRSADMGNPDAQYYIGKLLSYVPNGGDIMRAMYKCAMEQGHPLAGRDYASYSKVLGLYQESLEGYQYATRSGNANSARNLSKSFNGPVASDRLYYLSLQRDVERVERYHEIYNFLTRHEHLGAKVPDLESIVPLPPAILPEWDGTFQWKRERDSAVPVIPSPDLIEKLSAEKGLDPSTGLPLTVRKP
ncbi:DUF6396 domain-containing protein [Pseudomonas silesiensis]